MSQPAQSDPPAEFDWRMLQPPEPLVRILEMAPAMKAGEKFRVLLPHVPYPLLPHLDGYGLAYRFELLEDGSARVEIWRPAA